MRVSVVVIGVLGCVMARSIARADTQPATGLIAGASLAVVHIEDKTAQESMEGVGPVVEVSGGWWLASWFGATVSASVATMGTDLPLMLASGRQDHLRQWDLAVVARGLIRVNSAFYFGVGVGAVDDRESFVGISSAQTSRLYDLTVVITPWQPAGHPLDLVLRASEAPTQDGAFPIYTFGAGVGARL